MYRLRRSSTAATLLAAGVLHFAGCGTTRSSDTTRTATEQLLISDAVDRAVQSLNLQPLAGQKVFLDDSKLAEAVDRNYFISTLRQQLLASACELKEKREEADFVVEARAGAIGTDRNDQLFGLPSMNVPQIPLVQPVPGVIPEIPIAKRKDQRGIAKIAVFAYHRETGTPVWQSGIVRQESSANDVWIMGAGPFQRGTIYDSTTAASKDPQADSANGKVAARKSRVDLAHENLFTPPEKFAKQATAPAESNVAQAVHQESAPATPSTAAPPVVASAAAPTASPPAAAPAPTQTVAQPSDPTTPAATAQSKPPKPVPAGLSAGLDASNPQTPNSVYTNAGDPAPLPQPRFNSPK